MDAPPVSIRGLVKRYGDLVAVDGLDLEVRPGECLALLGPNGAGKTSALRVVLCAAPFQAGRVEVFGLDVTRRPREVKAMIGLVPQEDSLDVDLDVRSNLVIYASYFRISRREAERRADEALAFVGLSARREAEIHELSGGMRRRLLVARALLHDPPLLIMDEPTTGLDPHARRAIWARLRDLRARGRTILFTTHYMEEAAALADRVVLMDRGRAVAEGSPADLVRGVEGAGSLEDVFLRLTDHGGEG